MILPKRSDYGMYRLVLLREALRVYARVDQPAAPQARCFAALEQGPRGGNNVKPLKGKVAGAYCYRVGDLRVGYTIDDTGATVFVITIANRRDGYE